jgi:hypothetical protein
LHRHFFKPNVITTHSNKLIKSGHQKAVLDISSLAMKT